MTTKNPIPALVVGIPVAFGLDAYLFGAAGVAIDGLLLLIPLSLMTMRKV